MTTENFMATGSSQLVMTSSYFKLPQLPDCSEMVVMIHWFSNESVSTGCDPLVASLLPLTNDSPIQEMSFSVGDLVTGQV